MYIMGENPAMSDPDVAACPRRAGEARPPGGAGPFLTETAALADVILPASAWPEKDGTVTNTNRQVQMGRAAVPLPAGVRQDLDIIVELARRLGLHWTYAHPRDVFPEMAAATPSLANISWERLEREGSVTYPCHTPDGPGEAIVFGDRFPTATGRARFVTAGLRDPDEMPDERYPLILTTGRQLEHWHTGSMTRRAGMLDALEPEPTASWHRRAGAAGPHPRPAPAAADPARRDRAGGALRPGIAGGAGLRSLRLPRGGGQPADQPEARSLRQDSRIQVLRRTGRSGPTRT